MLFCILLVFRLSFVVPRKLDADVWIPITDPTEEQLPPVPTTHEQLLPDPDPTKLPPDSRFAEYDNFITKPTPSYPDEGEKPVDELNTCSTGSNAGYPYSSAELEILGRITTLTDRYSRLRSHKPLVKHQLKSKLSFLRRLLGKAGQDPTDEGFENGPLGLTRSIPLQFIRALNFVAGETSTVLGYLWAFGYLPKVLNITETESEDVADLTADQVTPCQLQQAIVEFQKFNGLQTTGTLDLETQGRMKKPRCGLLDVRKKNKKKKKKRIKRYALRKRSWNVRNPLTYHVVNCTARLEPDVCKEEIRLALERWTEHAPIVFQEVSRQEDAMFVLLFVSGVHPKKNVKSAQNDVPFDGEGGVLGHAYFPRGGHIHFDADEDWTAESNSGVSVQFVALHEMGHALGLEHTAVSDSIMSPVYDPERGWQWNLELKADDIAGIKDKYGEGKGKVITL